VVGLLLVVIFLRLSLKTSTIQNWVRSYVETTANQQLNADLSIDQLSGDLWKKAMLSGISLVRQDTVAQIDSIHVEYNVWSLFAGRIEASDLQVYGPTLRLRQQQNRWNVQNIVSASDAEKSSGEMWPIAIDNVILQGGTISVQSDSMPLESNFNIDELEISSSLALAPESFRVDLQNLSFVLTNTQLDQPLRVETTASARQEKITLENLLLATGNSVIRSSGFASPVDSTLQFDLSAAPVAWKDITNYARDFPLRKDLTFDLVLQGNPEQFDVTLRANAEGLDSLEIMSQFQWQSKLVLQRATANMNGFYPSLLLSDTTLPSLEHANAEFTGSVDMANINSSEGNITFDLNNISRESYQLDQLTGQGSLNEQQATLKLRANKRGQTVSSTLNAKQLWSASPRINGIIEAQNVDPEIWLQDTTYAGNISFQSTFSGTGWYPQQQPWDYSLEVDNSRAIGQQIDSFSASGTIGSQTATVDAQLTMGESIIELTGNIEDFTSRPRYDYTLETRDFNLGPLMGRENFTTALNAKLSGRGTEFDPSLMQLNSSVAIDSSIINGELVEDLSAEISIRDTVAVVDSASLRSSIADGSFNINVNMLRPYDPDNRLSFDLMVKDISALAPLAQATDLQAEGGVKGNLSPVENGDLTFVGTVDLSSIVYDEFFAADQAAGSIEVRRQQGLSYQGDLNLKAPTFAGVQLQDLTLQTMGNYADKRADGSYQFRFSSPNEGYIKQAGYYMLAPDTAQIRTTVLDIVSDVRTLSLDQSFVIRVQGNTLRMDTMRVSADNGAFLEVGLPILSAQEQRGYIHGNALNTAVIQNSILGESYFEGLLSGQFEFSRRDTNLTAGGELLISEVTFADTDIDSFFVVGQVRDERLNGSLSVRNEGVQLVNGTLQLPFKLGDPEELPASFFEEQVDGHIEIQDVALERFQSLLSNIGLTETSGIFAFRGILDGKAGEPHFAADATLKNAQLSGVSVDSVTAGMDYSHEDAELQLHGAVQSLKQEAAQINARFPFFINMKTFRVNLPQKQDSITVGVETSNFNLKAVNDFLDPKKFRQVAGQLNGSVKVNGTMANLQTDGKLRLKQGAVRIVPAGVRIGDIGSTIVFDPNQVRISNFSAKSGSGSLTASGILELEKLVPGNIDIKVKAQNFRAANTSQYNAVVDLNAQATGQVTQPKVTGNLNFDSGFLQLQDFGEKSVENVRLDSSEQRGSSVSIYDSLALDMDVAFNRRFYIQNERYLEMEIELDGQVDLIKESGQDLQLFGTINAPNGYARPLGKEFTLEEGAVTFIDEPTNPELKIRTQYKPPQTQEDVTIWYIIEGTVENPKFKYESEPPMELQNIISYTLFGQPFYALNSWKQVVTRSGSNSAPADVALDVLLDRVEALATKQLGIDVVKIDNSQVGGETGTSITTGWYLNPKVFFAIQNVITGASPDTGFLLEYMLRKDLKLILQQGNNNRQGVDIRWNYDY
jgi:autotransporter translocation and assembly factor TamB